MRVSVLYHGVLKELAGRASAEMEFAEGTCVSDLWANLCGDIPKMNGYSRSVAIAVNQEFASPDTVLKDGDEVALLPPVSGGAPDEAYVRIVHEPIDTSDIVPKLERPEDGAVVIFDGIVRNHSRNRRTLYLEYEGYEPMALKLMEELAAQAREKFAIRNVALVHRLGHLEIGESSVLIAVFSAHRAAAFDACRWMIDTLKKTVPIYKKEFFEDGAVWADGEPFPDNVPRISDSR